MRLDAYASDTHYADHLAPIWTELPDEARGTFYAHNPRLADYLDRTHLIDARATGPPMGLELLLVASYRDELRGRAREVIFLEHGAGQSYGDLGDGSYAGDKPRPNVRLYLAPNELVAGRARPTVTNGTVAIVGTPKLDAYHLDPPAPRGARAPVVAFAWHWDATIAPETRTALPHYRRHLGTVADYFGGANIIGHGHPRLWPQRSHALEATYLRFGITPYRHARTVLDEADLLIADNTSLLYEFASTGRPVLVLNAPFYRRNVHHGLRFWDLIPGLQVDHPAELVDRAVQALEDPLEVRELRTAVLEEVYPLADGRAAERAAEEVLNVIT